MLQTMCGGMEETMRREIANRWNVVARRTCAIALSGVLALGMAGCASTSGAAGSSSASDTQSSSATNSEDSSSVEVPSSDAAQQNGSTTVAYAAEIDESPYDLEYSKRDSDPSYDASKAVGITLNGTTIEASDPNVTVDGSTVTISAEGVYVLSGTLENGQVVVNAPEDAKVQIVLNGASVTNATGPALYVQQADKCFVTLADGTENALADGSEYADADSDASAALYSTCDLTLQGSGKLSVSGNFKDAVKTKDDLVITGGSYALKAASDALNGNDSVKVSGGTFAVDAGNDGIKSGKDDDDSKGFVSIDGGSFVLSAGDKYIRVSESAKIDMTTGGDAIHSDSFARIAGGDLTISSGDDAVHAEYVLVVDDGNIDVTKCAEGYEAQVITVNGSTTHIVSSDDGINASSGGTSSGDKGGKQDFGDFNPNRDWGEGQRPDRESQEGQGGDALPSSEEGAPEGDWQGETPPEAPSGEAPEGMPTPPDFPDGADGQEGGWPNGMGGAFMFDSDENCILTFNGGTVYVEVEGDGIDSNGYIYLNGGSVYVSGPTRGGNGSLDYGLGGEANAGTFIAAGSMGMAETFSGGTQGSALVNASGSAGDVIVVSDANGNKLAEYTPTKDFQCVTVSAPGMVDGGEYTLSVNGVETSFTASTSGASGNAGQMGGWGESGSWKNQDGQTPEGRERGERRTRPDASSSDSPTSSTAV